ncbi:hypothetical protein HDU88_005079 [Geranomyces variabilis]|nr:hypothetical protein HDU88_005079 [Geranomyces variabilis]
MTEHRVRYTSLRVGGARFNRMTLFLLVALVFVGLFSLLAAHYAKLPELASRAKAKLLGSSLDGADPWKWNYDRDTEACSPTEVEDNRAFWNKPLGNKDEVNSNHWDMPHDEFNTLIYKDTLPLGIRDGDRVYEAGCGNGAFLAGIKEYYKVAVAGSDFSEALVQKAKEKHPGENFAVQDVQDLKNADTESFDISLSHGVWYYLNAPANAELALLELLRITKPGGSIYVGDIDDPLQIARLGRQCGGEGGFKLEKKWWLEMAVKHNFQVSAVVDGKDTVARHWPHSAWRYNVYLRKAYPKRTTPCAGYLDVFC